MKSARKRSYTKMCPMCSNEFVGMHNQVWCSPKCSPYSKRIDTRTYPGLDVSTTGAVSELRAAADLMKRGYDVFRAMSPTATCDLIAVRNGKILRIEVRTSRRRALGGISFPNKTKDIGRSDHFAAVLSDEIVYIPELAT